MEELSKNRKADEGSESFDPSSLLNRNDARKILDPLTKEQLIKVLETTVFRYQGVLDAVRSVADFDSSKRKLYVRGLGQNISAEILRNIFSSYGEVEECIVIKDKSTGRSKGCGFVRFRHIDCAMAALQEPIKKINGVWVMTSLASARTNADVSLRKIYVGNIPLEMSGEGQLGFDKQSGKHQGFAFFTHKTDEGARASIMNGIQTIDGYQLNCKLACSMTSNNSDPNYGMRSCDYANLISSNGGGSYGWNQGPSSFDDTSGGYNRSMPDPNYGMESCGYEGLNSSNGNGRYANQGTSLFNGISGGYSMPDPNYGMGICDYAGLNSSNGNGSYGNQEPGYSEGWNNGMYDFVPRLPPNGRFLGANGLNDS